MYELDVMYLYLNNTPTHFLLRKS